MRYAFLCVCMRLENVRDEAEKNRIIDRGRKMCVHDEGLAVSQDRKICGISFQFLFFFLQVFFRKMKMGNCFLHPIVLVSQSYLSLIIIGHNAMYNVACYYLFYFFSIHFSFLLAMR